MKVISKSESLNNMTLSIAKKPNNRGFRLTINLIPLNEQVELT